MYIMYTNNWWKNAKIFIFMISGSKSIKPKESNRMNIEDYWDFDYFPEKNVE